MNQLKPIENWKFIVQIILATLILLMACFNGVKFIITEVSGEKFWKHQYIISYTSSFMWLALLIFQMLLFQSYPKIKTLFLVVIIMRLVMIGYGLIKQSYGKMDLEALEVSAMIEGILRLVSFIIALVLYGHILTKPYNQASLVKLFRPYAIITIVMDCIGFLFNFLLGFATIIHVQLYKFWGVAYFFYTVPMVFLIMYYIRLKELYPQLMKETDQTDTDQSWPPQQKSI
jgi:hypothetical protein